MNLGSPDGELVEACEKGFLKTGLGFIAEDDKARLGKGGKGAIVNPGLGLREARTENLFSSKEGLMLKGLTSGCFPSLLEGFCPGGVLTVLEGLMFSLQKFTS